MATTNTNPALGTCLFTNHDEPNLTCDNCGKQIPVGAEYVADFVTVCISCDHLFAAQDAATAREDRHHG